MFFFCGCACLSFSDILAYGYAIIMLNVIRSEITIKNLTTFFVETNAIPHPWFKAQGEVKIIPNLN